MKRKALLAALLCAFLLLGSFSACAEAAGGGRMTELPSRSSHAQNGGVYDEILQKYYDVLYADWYMPLTAEVIEDAIHAGLMQKSMEYILGSSGSWVTEAESSPDFDSGKFADQWSDVIYERDEYETTDGSRIKVSTQYDTVYQDGDRLYMGPDAYAPDGWTRLEKTY